MHLSDTVEQMTNPRNWELVFAKLGITKQFASRGKISCPMPGHTDEHPSCDVILDAPQGPILVCRTACNETITVTKLVMAYGAASSPSEALAWVDEAIGFERPTASRARARTRVQFDDPTQTVEMYQQMKGLSAATIHKFGLVDVRTYVAGRGKDPSAGFESGYYASVFMPTREGFRPRIRTYTQAKVKWAAGVRFADGSSVDFHRSSSGERLPMCVYGLDQIAASPVAARTLLVVEGESDVHTLHEMGFAACVGVPGTSMVSATAVSLAEAVLRIGEGTTDGVRVLVWQEPGAAGSAFPRDVARALTRELSTLDQPLPDVATIIGSSIDGAPKDPSALWLMQREKALPLLLAAIEEAAGRGLHPAMVGTTADRPAMLASFQDTGSASGQVPSAPVCAGRDDPWGVVLGFADAPADEALPDKVDGIGVRFERVKGGWLEWRWSDAKKEEVAKSVCDPFVVEGVLECGDDMLVTIAAPVGGRWDRRRVRYATASSNERTGEALLSHGVGVANRMKGSASDLIIALAKRIIAAGGVERIPAATGWSGGDGTSLFAGIECDTADEFGAWMFDANEARRAAHPDTAAAACEWWVCASKLLTRVEDPAACHAAPFLALGATAAAPLLGPLKKYRIDISPVVWIAGLGGGGKSVTQRLCASVFAPRRDNGQVGFMMGADISSAGLGSRAPSFRDLPVILDDVTQMKPDKSIGSGSGLAARVDTAAAVGMRLFNREPAQRSTRNHKARKAHPFRCTGLFSAEASMHDPALKSVATAGNRRRIATVGAKPMADRGLGGWFAGEVGRAADELGGAAGEQLVGLIRSLVSDGKLGERLSVASEAVRGIEVSKRTDATQMQSLTIMALGFGLLAEACGEDFGWALDEFVHALGAYLDADASAGGAVGEADVDGVQRAKEAVLSFYSSNVGRFITHEKGGLEEAGIELRSSPFSILGRFSSGSNFKDGSARLYLTDEAMAILESRHGVSPQMVLSATEEGSCLGRKRFRLVKGTGVRTYGTGWHVDKMSGGSEPHPDDEPEGPEPHDHDPHRLREPYVPGMSASTVSDEPASIVADDSAQVEPLESLEQAPVDLKEDPVFRYTDGTYLFSGDGTLSTDVLDGIVVRDAGVELGTMRQVWPEFEVADAPADDDPRWAKLEALGPERARGLYEQSRAALAHALTFEKNTPERHAAMGEYVRLYRLHILARLRRPGWFVTRYADPAAVAERERRDAGASNAVD